MALRRCGVLNTDILPLAITMMAGPQIMSAIIFVTSEEALKNSLAFDIGVLVATAVGVAALRGLQDLVGGAIDFGDPSDNGSTGHIIQYALVALLVAFAIKNMSAGRRSSRPSGSASSSRPTRSRPCAPACW